MTGVAGGSQDRSRKWFRSYVSANSRPSDLTFCIAHLTALPQIKSSSRAQSMSKWTEEAPSEALAPILLGVMETDDAKFQRGFPHNSQRCEEVC